MAPEKT